MVVDREKTVRLLREAILQLCRVSLMGSFEVDGIICISQNNTEEENQLVIKVHELVMEESVGCQDGKDMRKTQDGQRNKTLACRSNDNHENNIGTTNETASTWKNTGIDASAWNSDFAGCISGNSWKQLDRILRVQPSGHRLHASSRNNHKEIQELSIKKTVSKIEDNFYFACKPCSIAFSSKLALDNHLEQCPHRSSRNELVGPLPLEDGGSTFHPRPTRKGKKRKPLKGFDDVANSNNLNEKFVSSSCKPNNDFVPNDEFQSNAAPPDDDLSRAERAALSSDRFHSVDDTSRSLPQLDDGTGPAEIKSERQFMCEICSTEFPDLTSFSFHYRMVHNIYACTFCHEKFSDEQELRDHLTIHAERESFDCLLCGVELTRRSDLVAHHFQVHGLAMDAKFLQNNGDLEESCVENMPDDMAMDAVMFPNVDEFGQGNVSASGCNESDNQMLSLENEDPRGPHYSNFASKRVSNSQAFSPEFFCDDDQLYECDKCRELIRGSGVYQIHCKKLHRRTPCLHCGKTFSQKGNMERHMRLHAGFKPFRCHLCRRSFCRKEALLGHVNQDHIMALQNAS